MIVVQKLLAGLIFKDIAKYIIQNNQVIHSADIEPMNGLEVNGAGDVYAANFIKYYKMYDIIKSAEMAMTDTTDLLIRRNT